MEGSATQQSSLHCLSGANTISERVRGIASISAKPPTTCVPESRKPTSAHSQKERRSVRGPPYHWKHLHSLNRRPVHSVENSIKPDQKSLDQRKKNDMILGFDQNH
jgi:hypothetical protein